mmetsp:Transcript_85554/g.205068  ORF Transcript_85554/g.205068 Transcript_85554/m.205068 type:complete len:230 (-) Transcript_85554:96-785(-)
MAGRAAVPLRPRRHSALCFDGRYQAALYHGLVVPFCPQRMDHRRRQQASREPCSGALEGHHLHLRSHHVHGLLRGAGSCTVRFQIHGDELGGAPFGPRSAGREAAATLGPAGRLLGVGAARGLFFALHPLRDCHVPLLRKRYCHHCRHGPTAEHGVAGMHRSTLAGGHQSAVWHHAPAEQIGAELRLRVPLGALHRCRRLLPGAGLGLGCTPLFVQPVWESSESRGSVL